MNARPLLEGCGIGIALTLSYTWQPLSPFHLQSYLHILPNSSVAGGAVIDLGAASLLCCGALVLLDHFDNKLRTLLWVMLTAVVPAVLIRSALRLAEANFPIPSTLMIAALLLIPALILWRFWPTGYRTLIAGFRLVYLCMSVCLLWMVPELMYAAVRHEPRDAMETERLVSSRPEELASGSTRIVWLLLDELSYDQMIDHRQPGINLPNFDRMREESTSFADVQPAGYLTDEILPSLLSGRPVVNIESSPDGALLVRETSHGRWIRFNPYASLFGDAERLGWSTGIAGWFNPYCRLFGMVVDSCQWEPESRLYPGHMNAANSALENALAPLGAKFHGDADTRVSAEHGKAYRVLLQRGIALVRNQKERFVFVHLPVPHPPGIYDRANGQMRIGDSYLDNLVLADKTVGEVRSAIEETSMAGSTILLVTSDHSMRVPKWRGSASWTAEDERVFGKRFDTRPVLMIHFPAQQTGQTINAPFAAIQMHEMIEEMLEGKMQSDLQLMAWVRSQR